MRVVPPTRLGLRDLVGEAVSGMLARPGRAALTVLGTLLGVAAFVTVLGLTSTVQGQISNRFTALVATEVIVRDNAPGAFPSDAEQRLTRLNGVRSAGVFWEVPDPGPVATHRPTSAGDGEALKVVAASPGYLRAVHARLTAGRLFDTWHAAHHERVVVLGAGAAGRLGITWVDNQPAVFIGDTPFAVIGIVGDVDRQADTLLSVVVPDQTAQAVWGRPPAGAGTSAKALIDTRIGAARQVGAEAPYALRPEDPRRYQVVMPPDPQQLRQNVGTDLGTLFLALAAVCLIIGAVGIANTTLVAVLERIGEIGLRRALGARRRHVAAHFLVESGTLGLIGGLIGTSLGVAAVVTIAVWRQWTPILQPATVLPAPLVGAVTGLLAGLYPAWRASRIEPADALRR